jgi:hypothetical protein
LYRQRLRPEDFCDTNSSVQTGPDSDAPADYASALATAVRVRAWLVALLLFILLAELALFFLYRYCNTWEPRAIDLLKYCVGFVQFFGVCLSLLLMAVLLLALNITLAGRLNGAVDLVRALVWSFIAALLLFPWQAFLINQQFTSSAFKIPGVLYTWEELTLQARWNAGSMDFWATLLCWARFVGFPVSAICILLMVRFHSRRAANRRSDKQV